MDFALHLMQQSNRNLGRAVLAEGALGVLKERIAAYVEGLADISANEGVAGSGESRRRTQLLQTIADDIRERDWS